MKAAVMYGTSPANLNKRMTSAIGWAVSLLFALLIVFPIANNFFRHTIDLPFVLADMFSGLSTGFILGLSQVLIIRRVYRHVLSNWVFFGVLGGVLGTMLHNGVAIVMNAASGFPQQASIPLAMMFFYIGISQALSLNYRRLNPSRWMLVILLSTVGLASLMQTNFWLIILGVLSLGAYGGLNLAAGLEPIVDSQEKAKRDFREYQQAVHNLRAQDETISPSLMLHTAKTQEQSKP